MAYMPMHSPHSPIAYGGTGAITLMDGEAIPIMAGAVTHLTMPAAGASAGEDSMEAGVGDITTIMEAGIPVADTGAEATGEEDVCILTDDLMATVQPLIGVVHQQPVALRAPQADIKPDVVRALPAEQ